jgi:hypothetical protein
VVMTLSVHNDLGVRLVAALFNQRNMIYVNKTRAV